MTKYELSNEIFYPFEVVSRDSETQLQMGGNSNYFCWGSDGSSISRHCLSPADVNRLVPADADYCQSAAAVIKQFWKKTEYIYMFISNIS